MAGRQAGFGAAARIGRGAMAALALAAAFLAAAPSRAFAVEAAEKGVTDQTEARLWADRSVAAPGETLTAALQLSLAPHWHTYWINPGASGLETKLAWEAPEGVEIGPLRFPAPERIPFGGLVSFGFEKEAIHLAEISLPKDWPAGEPVTLKARADWLVCKEICLPEGRDFTLTVPTGARAEIDPAAAEIVARGRSREPVRTGAPARYEWLGDGRLRLAIDSPALAAADLSGHFFFPRDWRVAASGAEQSVERAAGGIALTLQPEDPGFEPPVTGVLRAEDSAGGVVAIEVSAEPGDGASAAPAAGPAAPTIEREAAAGAAAGPAPEASGAGGGAALQLGLGLDAGLGAAALLAFLGGLVLNLMPCVFPVLALKAMGIAKAAHAPGDRGRHGLAHGLAYGAGVTASFLAFAGALIALKSAGVAVGWGFQLQEPIVVAALAYVLVLVGLNLSGVYELSFGFAGAGGRLAGKPGAAGAFFTGVLAAVVAAPCTAPFMGAALGYALTQDAATSLIVFAALGLGFAAPILLLSAAPATARLVPKPGPWMARFRQLLAFPMYLAAVWLFWVLGNQAGADAQFAALAGAVLLAFGAWALGAGRPSGRGGRLAATVAAAAALAAALLALAPAWRHDPAVASAARQAAAGVEPYDSARLAALQAERRTVFLNVTADWCISCKVNEVNVLSGERFRTALAKADAVYMKGDWTVRDETITALLARFGRVGVPLYVVFPKDGGAPQVLPQILTHAILEEALVEG